MSDRRYIPALSLHWLTPLYDRLVEGPMSALRMRKDLLALAGDLNGKHILDVGSGTGTLVLAMKQANPAASVVGLDGDPVILEIARSKARERELEVQFDEGISFALPYPDASFDVVTTSLMLHHLDREAKLGTASEMHRILRPGGMVYGLDFAPAGGWTGKAMDRFARRVERIADNLDGLLPVIFRRAGFLDYTEERRYLFGLLSLFHASKN